jgi:hypothetical protein
MGHHHHPPAGYYPVTLEELKKNLRIPQCDTSKDEALMQSLDAANEYCQLFTGRNFRDYPENKFPHTLRYAILIVAGSFFKSPVDRVFTLPTQAQHFLKMHQILCSPYTSQNE